MKRVTTLFTEYDYASARAETEGFFWTTLADNYLELAKMRLYDATDPLAEGARYTLRTALLTCSSCSRHSCPTSPRRSTRRSLPTRVARFTAPAWPTLATLPAEHWRR